MPSGYCPIMADSFQHVTSLTCTRRDGPPSRQMPWWRTFTPQVPQRDRDSVSAWCEKLFVVPETSTAAAPRVFLSHSWLDKAEFVEPLATGLRSRGVDAWLDKWELRPGDSMIQQIVNQAITATDVLVVVVSTNSVTSTWVTQELDAGLTRRLNDGLRVIAVRLDGVDMPLVLQTMLYIDATRDEQGVNLTTERIVSTVFNHDPRPALGTPPAYTQITPTIPGLRTTDTVLLLETVRAAQLRDDPLGLTFLDWEPIKASAVETGLTAQDIETARDVLARRHLVAVTGHRDIVRRYDLTPAGFHAGISGVEPRAEQTRLALIALLLETDFHSTKHWLDTSEIAANLDTTRLMVEQHLEKLRAQGFLRFTRASGGHILTHVSPELARELE